MRRTQGDTDLDQRIARIRKQNEEIERRQQIIDEDIRLAQKNNAMVNVKLSNTVYSDEDEEEDKFGRNLYSDQILSKTSSTRIVQAPQRMINLRLSNGKNTSFNRNIDKDAEWRLERKLIDEERINRQKEIDGMWKREWDMDKEDIDSIDVQYDGKRNWCDEDWNSCERQSRIVMNNQETAKCANYGNRKVVYNNKGMREMPAVQSFPVNKWRYERKTSLEQLQKNTTYKENISGNVVSRVPQYNTLHSNGNGILRDAYQNNKQYTSRNVTFGRGKRVSNIVRKVDYPNIIAANKLYEDGGMQNERQFLTEEDEENMEENNSIDEEDQDNDANINEEDDHDEYLEIIDDEVEGECKENIESRNKVFFDGLQCTASLMNERFGSLPQNDLTAVVNDVLHSGQSFSCESETYEGNNLSEKDILESRTMVHCCEKDPNDKKVVLRDNMLIVHLYKKNYNSTKNYTRTPCLFEQNQKADKTLFRNNNDNNSKVLNPTCRNVIFQEEAVNEDDEWEDISDDEN